IVRGDRLEHRPGPPRDPCPLPRARARRRAAPQGRRRRHPRRPAPPRRPHGRGRPRLPPDPCTPRLPGILSIANPKSKIQNGGGRGMRILTAEAMREVDRAAVEELGVPSLVLMENAAIGVVEAIAEAFADARSAAVFCGPGNNGGDGLAVARHLFVRGWEARIFLVANSHPLSADAAAQLAICRKAELQILEIGGEKDLRVALEAAADCDLAIDALFGTGLSRPLDGLFARVVDR